MATLLKDKIKVETHHGTCDIELMFGSVTKLSKEDEVDVLVVSAYPGRPMPFIKIFVGINIHNKHTCSHAPHDIKLHWKTSGSAREI